MIQIIGSAYLELLCPRQRYSPCSFDDGEVNAIGYIRTFVCSFVCVQVITHKAVDVFSTISGVSSWVTEEAGFISNPDRIPVPE